MRWRLHLRDRRWRRLAGAAALAATLLWPGGAAAADIAAAQPIKEPHYGDSLFHFFQDHYFSSVTSLMVSQHFERVEQHADEAEVLRGGLLLSYGMHREAGDIFARLIENGAAPPVRDRAWFYLAKIRYQRGWLAEADDAIGRIATHLPPDLEEERLLLKAYLSMARADYAGAAGVLNALTSSSGAGPYARYNLGVALVRSGDVARGSVLLDELGRTPASSEEYRSLRDRANVALGFAALQQQRPEQARTYLERVRLSGLHANKALLGFGWAAAELKAPKQALVPWTELAERDASDAAALEARIAVPYALVELGAYGQALERYDEAIAAFDREGTKLDDSIAAIRAGKLIDGLIERNPGDEMGWFRTIDELPEMPHASHLSQALAGHEFQEAFKNYRDLRFLATNLRQWHERLGVFDDMLAHRRKAYAERLPQTRAQARAIDIGALQKRRDGVAAELANAQAASDGVALADAKERDLLARLASVQATLQRQGSEPGLAASARDRARLAAGALRWQLAQAYPTRVWEATKGITAIDTELAEARRRDSALAQAQRDEPGRFDALAQRIAALRPRIEALVPRVAALSREQQGVAEQFAVAELLQQKERLAVYATQARFAVAQLYDRAHLARKDSHATRP